MGVKVEFNNDLALRNIEEFSKGNRKLEECIPSNIQPNQIYEFLKQGQRIYELNKPIPLLETTGNQQFTGNIAKIIILEATHIILDNQIYTKGKYRLV